MTRAPKLTAGRRRLLRSVADWRVVQLDDGRTWDLSRAAPLVVTFAVGFLARAGWVALEAHQDRPPLFWSITPPGLAVLDG